MGIRLGYLYGGKVKGDLNLGDTDPYTGSPCTAYISGHVTTKLQTLQPSSAPVSPSAGDIYFDVTTKKLLVYNGTAWETISST